jgi:serine/threonine protein kinase
VTPAALKAPEAILSCPAGRGIDIWSFGCLVFEFLTDLPLFRLPPIFDSHESLDDDHLIQLTEVMQPLPKNLLSKWPRLAGTLHPTGNVLIHSLGSSKEAGVLTKTQPARMRRTRGMMSLMT